MKKRVPLFSVALLVLAAAIAIYAFERSGFWLGAFAMFLLWWADNDRKQTARRMREALLIAEVAPELVGKEFVEASAYTLEEIDRFNAKATPDAKKAFYDALSASLAAWTRCGETMPIWATLPLLRRVETAWALSRSRARSRLALALCFVP